MSGDFFDPRPEQQNVILIDAAALRKAEALIESCERRREILEKTLIEPR
jgi:hypothetical protein